MSELTLPAPSLAASLPTTAMMATLAPFLVGSSREGSHPQKSLLQCVMGLEETTFSFKN